MNKIPTVFARDPENMARVTRDVHPDCGWVLAGEGRATRKWDGTCVLLSEDGHWWARREVKPGKALPDGFVEVHYDEVTGKRQGWEPIEQSAFAKAFRDALDQPWSKSEHGDTPAYAPGTYELVGPKVNGNPDGFERHTLVRHGRSSAGDTLIGGQRTRESIREDVAHAAGNGAEGIVYHHPDGRMAKIKARDYGIERAKGLTL